MNYKQFITTFTFIALSFIVNAQLSLPTMNVGDKLFYYYQVADHESIHGVAQKLGVSADVIAQVNPYVSNGISKGNLIFFPVDNKKSTATKNEIKFKNSTTSTYTLQQGDNIYTVAQRHNSSIESLLRNNINISPDKYTPGTKIKVTSNSALPLAYDKKDYKFYAHVIGKDESLYSIANNYGISQNDLQMVNPGLTKLKKGKTIIIPKLTSTQVMGEISSIDLNDLKNYYATRINDIYFKVVEEERNSEIKIGIILPFQLHKQDAPRQAYLYTDFLKGFMLALDSARNEVSKKISVKVYDTQHNLNVTDSLLALDEMKNLHLIIAPGEPQQLQRINNFGRDNNINVINCFATKSDDYLNTPSILQVNTPTPIMVRNVANWINTRFSECTVVYLKDEANESNEIFDNFLSDLNSRSLPSQSLIIDGELSYDNLSRILNPGSNYVFIPSNGSKNLLKKIIPALKRAKSERFDCEINLIGMPEYVLYLKDYQSDLMAIDTYMFSRFFNTKGFRTRNVENSYSTWFGGKMLDSYPHMGLFGFDTGSYLLHTLGNNQMLNETTPLYKGIQTGFKFSHDNNSDGLVNEAITLVHFSNDNKIESFIVTDR